MRGAGDAQALAQAGQLVTEAARPTIAELKQATASVAQVQSILRRATPWVSWQYLALIAAGCAVLVLAVWIAVAWQRRELGELRDQKAVLEAEIPTLQATVDELTAKGGKIKLSACGKDQRKCVKVNSGMGTFGKAGDSYMILDGYRWPPQNPVSLARTVAHPSQSAVTRQRLRSCPGNCETRKL